MTLLLSFLLLLHLSLSSSFCHSYSNKIKLFRFRYYYNPTHSTTTPHRLFTSTRSPFSTMSQTNWEADKMQVFNLSFLIHHFTNMGFLFHALLFLFFFHFFLFLNGFFLLFSSALVYFIIIINAHTFSLLGFLGFIRNC